jgi:membrane-associated phospholipid phosphatase
MQTAGEPFQSNGETTVPKALPGLPASPPRRLRGWPVLLPVFFCWLVAFLVALPLDRPVASWVRSSGLSREVEGKWWAEAIKAPGDFRFTVVVAVLLWLTRRIGWHQGVFIVLAGVVSGINGLFKWMVGRTRPFKLPLHELHPFYFEPFRGGLRHFLDQKDLCFPSGHAFTAFALAVAVLLVWRRGAWIFLTLAVLVGMERVAENAHYLSDVVGGVGFSILFVALLHRVMSGWMNSIEKNGFPIRLSPVKPASGTVRT